MLDMGFEEDIKKILGHMKSKDRQTMFFTATWPVSVQKIAESILRNPVEIRIGSSNQLVANKDIKQVSALIIEDQSHVKGG